MTDSPSLADKPVIALESGHWYTPDGEPRYTTTSANGNERATTLRDAKKHGWVPSVTTVIRTAATPGLNIWKEKQILLAALTLPRREGESEDAFAERVIADSQEQARIARERGASLHTAIERSIQRKSSEDRWWSHADTVCAMLMSIGVDLRDGEAEHSFAHSLGYGGKIDFFSRKQNVVVDFKNKPKIEPDKKLAWPEHALQLAAYSRGLKMHTARLINVFVGVEDAQVSLHEWTVEESKRYWLQFKALLEYWKIANQFPTP